MLPYTWSEYWQVKKLHECKIDRLITKIKFYISENYEIKKQRFYTDKKNSQWVLGLKPHESVCTIKSQQRNLS